MLSDKEEAAFEEVMGSLRPARYRSQHRRRSRIFPAVFTFILTLIAIFGSNALVLG